MPDQVPLGRAGRLWLIGRLESAQRGATLLDRKRQLLRRELDRLSSRRHETARRWAEACAEAERWGLRATALGGASDVAEAAAALAGRAEVEVAWTNTMGVMHPEEPRCALPALPAAAGAAANGAVPPAADAHRRAIEAAVAHAAVDASWRVLDAELRSTERHVRAIERHRIPALESALRRLELLLEELEREERVVTRWAEQRREGGSAGAM